MNTTMENRRQNFYSQFVIILLALIALRLWMMPIDLLPAVHAQVPNSGAQRQQLIKATAQTNTLLTEINQTLKSGTIQVKFEELKQNAKTNKKKK